ncbi:unnamed protein product [Rotaria sp. Silwood1]|nr:unnamed protein product [Rotaria sp. Silwood1]CAF4638804.1 unnamed protein product [Rotaria sp. Silwood1]
MVTEPTVSSLWFVESSEDNHTTASRSTTIDNHSLISYYPYSSLYKAEVLIDGHLKKNWNTCWTKVVAVNELIIGLLIFIIGILMVLFQLSLSSTAHGIWTGALVFIAGLFAFFTIIYRRHRFFLVVASIHIITGLASTILIFISVFAIALQMNNKNSNFTININDRQLNYGLHVTLIILGRPALKLTFTPDEKYFTNGHQVDIQCELLNPNDHTEAPQLWHVDIKTGKHSPISRLLINSPSNEAPDSYRRNSNKRIEFIKKNHIRIRHLQLEDSARYECNCPDCEQQLEEQKKVLQVMRLAEPRWHIEPGWPIQENAKTTIKCTVDDFYPYVSHKIIRNHHEINDGKTTPPNPNTFPQKFSWEATVTPTADWHNQTLQCTVTQGNTEQHALKVLDVLFTPRFLKCDEKQYVNSTKENATIECSYSGNPAPTLTWFHQTDEKPIRSETGITIETKDEHHGKYKSVVTFDREKLIAIPLTTTTMAPSSNGKSDTTIKPKATGDNYYQQLLTDGFIVKLTYNNEEKGLHKINIVSDVNEVRSNALDSSSIKTIHNLSTSIMFLLFLTILYMIQYH